jgi:hypothetical protein
MKHASHDLRVACALDGSTRWSGSPCDGLPLAPPSNGQQSTA